MLLIETLNMEGQPQILRYSIGMFIGLIAYFFLIKILGFEDITQLRLFNFIIMLVGLHRLIKRNMSQFSTSYFGNLFLAFRTAALTIVMVIVSLFIYLNWIDPSFLLVLEDSLGWGNNLGLIQVLAAVTIEGMASSFLLSYIIMQYMKSHKLNTANKTN